MSAAGYKMGPKTSAKAISGLEPPKSESTVEKGGFRRILRWEGEKLVSNMNEDTSGDGLVLPLYRISNLSLNNISILPLQTTKYVIFSATPHLGDSKPHLIHSYYSFTHP